ncbi:MAG: hypothetical protein P8R42_20550 [Candidatus Binatia bacterium]|nr:hypothetical protein [Candidatus Binatia bacterium]
MPRSGWTLYGLTESLRAQDQSTGAEVVQEQQEESWSRADVPLSSSVF